MLWAACRQGSLLSLPGRASVAVFWGGRGRSLAQVCGHHRASAAGLGWVLGEARRMGLGATVWALACSSLGGCAEASTLMRLGW